MHDNFLFLSFRGRTIALKTGDWFVVHPLLLAMMGQFSFMHYIKQPMNSFKTSLIYFTQFKPTNSITLVNFRKIMLVIIDGYNLINLSNSLRHSERLSLEERRNRLIQRLAKHKKYSGHKIIIVFDGWISGSFTEERQVEKGIEVIYSKRGEKADEVIKRLAKRAMQEVIVVTSDREIADSVWKSGGVVFSSQEFESKLTSQATHLPHEKDATEDDDNKSLNTKKKGPAKRLSKRKRLIQRKLQKF